MELSIIPFSLISYNMEEDAPPKCLTLKNKQLVDVQNALRQKGSPVCFVNKSHGHL